MIRLRRGRFFWKLFLANAAVVAVVLAGAAWFLGRALDAFHAASLATNLRVQAATLGEFAQGNLSREHMQELQALARHVLVAYDGIRVTFMDAHGVVLLDSAEDAMHMANHLNRPEILNARDEGRGETTRWSETVARDLTYVALRVGPADRPEGYVRVALSARSLAAQTSGWHRLTWVTFGTAMLAALLLGLGLALFWERRMARISAVARSLSRGDLNARVTVTGSDDVALLARALNRMRDRLATQVATVDRHRRTLESLVGQLREGVVVANAEGHVVVMNAAARLLLNPGAPVSAEVEFESTLPLEKLVPQHELQRMMTRNGGSLLHSGDGPPDEARIELDGPSGTVTVSARASDLLLPAPRATVDAAAEPTRGRLLVLTDITALVRAVRIRSDFVTNASHELRTPVAAIRAAVETLLTLDFSRDGASARRFIEMIERHGGRLEALATDLLELSRVESGGDRFSPSPLPVARICTDLHERWREAMEAGRLAWRCQGVDTCPTVVANANLMQLILDNLVDNAIKFTPPGGSIGLTWRRVDGWLAIDVSDTGCGIPPEDQTRVFERFYQVAVARSEPGGAERIQRGTGLGLSIVRHAAAALGGDVSLRSASGAGTTVTLKIPQGRSPSDNRGSAS